MIGFTKEVVFNPVNVTVAVVGKLVECLRNGKNAVVIIPAGKAGIVSRDAILNYLAGIAHLTGMGNFNFTKHPCKVQNNGATIRFLSPANLRGIPSANVLVYSLDKVSEELLQTILYTDPEKLTVVEVR